MSEKAEFCIVMVLVILPFLIVSMLSDMTKRGLLCLVAAISTVLLIYLIHLTPFGEAFGNFFSQGGLASYVLSGTVLSFILLSVILWLHARRRNFRGLNWPKNISTEQMERHGVAYLRRNGWTVLEQGSFGGSRIFRCKKDQSRLVIVFVTGYLDLEGFCNEIRFRRFDLYSAVVACRQMPSNNMVKVARERGPTIVYYDALLQVDQIAKDVHAHFIKAKYARIAAQNKALSS